MYRNGNGVDQSDATAAQWYRKAADLGCKQSQFNLGCMYKNGVGVTKNLSTAVEWWRKAGDEGYAEAQCSLGIMYLHGVRVTENSLRLLFLGDYAAFCIVRCALVLFTALELTFTSALVNSSSTLHNQRIKLGVTKDDATAARWHRKAAEQGFERAQCQLAALYCAGRGVPQSFAESIRWFEKAQAQGSTQAKQAIKEVSMLMRQQQHKAAAPAHAVVKKKKG